MRELFYLLALCWKLHGNATQALEQDAEGNMETKSRGSRKAGPELPRTVQGQALV